jgi:hypothetical protein
MSVTFRVTENGTSQLGMNFRSARFLYNMLTSFRTYQSWQIAEHRRIQKRTTRRVGSLLMSVAFRVTENGTSQLGINFRSVRFMHLRLMLSIRMYQSWQIVEHRLIQKKEQTSV